MDANTLVVKGHGVENAERRALHMQNTPMLWSKRDLKTDPGGVVYTTTAVKMGQKCQRLVGDKRRRERRGMLG